MDIQEELDRIEREMQEAMLDDQDAGHVTGDQALQRLVLLLSMGHEHEFQIREILSKYGSFPKWYA